MSEKTVLCGSSTSRDLNFFALLRFDVKLGYVLFPLFWFYKRYHFCQKSISLLLDIRWSRFEVPYFAKLL